MFTHLCSRIISIQGSKSAFKSVLLDSIIESKFSLKTDVVGGSAGARTPDHLIKSQMLYQLSYRPTSYTISNLEGFWGLNKPSKRTYILEYTLVIVQ